ncbi:hypothetical protein JTE90_008782 [Oedothorax gibbosus]|uniref:Lipase domain-containing protein n=1 Tax=Oedothorax gibbosus TaxID=931172 RepID=A0AAV6V6E3_9ARAC|nr:hypothetical protein JTE90_008782 [Oedothorax gibbosus]
MWISLAAYVQILFKCIQIGETAMSSEFPEKCYPTLGCFPTGPQFYDPPECADSPLPFDLNYIDTDFLLFTTSNPKNPITFKFDNQSLPELPFDKKLDTKVIVHGYYSLLPQNSSYHEMKDALLKQGSYNVVLVNWTSSNQPPYTQAVANARVVAAQLAHVINTLEITRGLQPSLVHLIGHSLGAHLVGFAGKRIKGFGRITGLDPAGPCFRKADSGRLHSGDAVFVDVIVTNGASYKDQGSGLYESVGDITFYPNGGRQQPGCEPPEGTPQKDRQSYINDCSHLRPVDLFTSSETSSVVVQCYTP